MPDGFATGVWSWDREAIMASGANTLAELFAEVPGMVPLWGGDYGTPIALSAFGSGGGGVRLEGVSHRPAPLRVSHRWKVGGRVCAATLCVLTTVDIGDVAARLAAQLLASRWDCAGGRLVSAV